MSKNALLVGMCIGVHWWRRCWLPLVLLILLPWTLSAFGQATEGGAEGASSGTTNELARLESLVGTLEDPARREAFIADLKALLDAQRAPAESEVAKPAESPVRRFLDALSRRLDGLGEELRGFTGQVARATELPAWVQRQVSDPQRRTVWIEVIRNFVLILSAGYGAWWMLGLVSRRISEPLVQKSPERGFGRFGIRLLVSAIALVPLLAFAGVSYAMVTLLGPREQTRLLALAWVHASLVVRLILWVEDLFLSPQFPKLRWLPADDETALFLRIWTVRLSVVGVYGYLFLQSALLLGLPADTYQACLKLLGLGVVALMGVFVFQVRDGVAAFLRGDGEGKLTGIRSRIAALWHWVALVYLGALYCIWVFAIPEGPGFLARTTVLTAVIVTAAGFAMRGLNRLWERGLRIPEDWKATFPNLEQRANRYLPALQKLSRWCLGSLATLAIFQVWGLDVLQWLASEDGRGMLVTLVKVVAIVVVSLGIWEATSLGIAAYLAETDAQGNPRIPNARAKTLLSVAQKALLIALSVIALLLILSEIGLNTAPLLAGAGVLGLAIGFGSQSLVKDVITGFFILLENLFSVGDVIKVGDTAGLVEAVSIRNVRLRDFSGTVHTIPYSSINTISNLTKEFSFYVFDIGVAYRENVDEVIEVMKQVGDDLQQDPEFGPLILAPLEVVGLDRFADSAIVIKARIKTKPIKQWGVGRAYNRRLKKKFDELGIEIPFPHQTVYFGADKDGASIPARIEMLSRKESETAAAEETAESSEVPSSKVKA